MPSDFSNSYIYLDLQNLDGIMAVYHLFFIDEAKFFIILYLSFKHYDSTT
jgi:hypothetical protein